MGTHNTGASTIQLPLALLLLLLLTPSLGSMEIYDITCHSVIHEYDDVYTWHFKPSGAAIPAMMDGSPWSAGMMAHFVAPDSGLNRDGVRHMSFASSPKDDVYTFSMDLASHTPFKQKMASLLPGGKAQLFKIKGQFTLDPTEQHRVLFLAGGIGITPIRSLIRTYHGAIDWSLLHVARDGKHLYERELAALDRPQVRTDHAGVRTALEMAVSEAPPDTWYFVCGSERFMHGMLSALEELGVPPNKIRAENFGCFRACPGIVSHQELATWLSWQRTGNIVKPRQPSVGQLQCELAPAVDMRLLSPCSRSQGCNVTTLMCFTATSGTMRMWRAAFGHMYRGVILVDSP